MEVLGNWILAEGYPGSLEVLFPAFKAAGRDSADNALNADDDDTSIFFAVNVPWFRHWRVPLFSKIADIRHLQGAVQFRQFTGELAKTKVF